MISVTLEHVEFLKRFRVLAYALVMIAVTGFAFAEGNLGLFMFAAIGCSISWWIVEKQGRQLPRSMINLGVLIASIMLFYELVLSPNESNLLLSLGHFMVAILMCKMFEPKGSRDYAQIYILSLLIIVASAIFSQQSILFGLILAVYLSLGLYGILIFHLRHEAHAAVERNAAPGAALSKDAQSDVRYHIRRISKLAALILLAIAIIVFLIFPRGRANDLLANWALQGNQRTGFSDSVRLMDFTRLQQSDAVAMEVKLMQGDLNVGTELYQPYFRGVVLDSYDPERRRWGRSSSSPRATTSDVTRGRTIVAGENIPDVAPTMTQDYTIFSSTSGALFSMNSPIAIETSQLTKVTYYPDTQTLDYAMRSFPPPLQYRLQTTIVPRPNRNDDLLRVPPGTLRAQNGQDESELIEIPREIMDLARKVAGDALPANLARMTSEEARILAERFENYLRSEYRYSLSSRAVDRSLDPTADFLLNRKTIGGHCEYFASAMIMLCRSVGINARMVTGFRGGEFNSLGGYYVVREKHAHAWVEIFLPPRGWVVYDPTPGATTEEPGALSEWTRWFREMSELVQKNWLASVVSFDNSSRRNIAQYFSARAEAVGNWFSETFAEARDTVREMFLGRSVSFWQRFGVTAAFGFCLALAYWLFKRIYRRRRSRIGMILRSLDKKAQRQLSEQLLFFDDVLALLARGRRRKHDHETPLEYVNELSPQLGPATADARWLIRAFYDVRFGSTPMTPALNKQIASTYSRLKSTLTGRQN